MALMQDVLYKFCDANNLSRWLPSELFSEWHATSFCIDFKCFKNSHEDLFETFKVPVLVNDGMNDSREEDLLGLVGKKIEEVVHFVDTFSIFKILEAPLWE